MHIQCIFAAAIQAFPCMLSFGNKFTFSPESEFTLGLREYQTTEQQGTNWPVCH